MRTDESIFAQGLGPHVLWVGLLMGTVTLLTQASAYRSGSAHWQSMTFTVLTLSPMGHVLAIRSERDSLLQRGLASNRALLGAVVLTCALQLATLYVPALHPIFKTEPLSAVELDVAGPSLHQSSRQDPREPGGDHPLDHCGRR